MKTSQSLLAASSLLCTASMVLAQAPASPSVALKAPVYQGCFSSGGTLQDQGSYTFQTTGYCQNVSVTSLNKPVMALTGGSDCWAGDDVPSASNKVDDSNCNSKCNGYAQQTCGGNNFWAVWLTGSQGSVGTAGPSSNSAPSTTTASNNQNPSKTISPSTITEAGQTVVVTAPGQAGAASGSTKSTKSSGTNKAAIAAGVVVGLVGVCALAGGAFLFLRARKRRSVEEEYRRNAAISGITGGSKPDSASSVSDSRLEPSVMMQRRMSDGSIADNQDYSRRILKVTNPDGT